jgi:hypothetical protein
VGASAPAARLDRLVSVSGTEARRAALRQAGVGLLGFGPVQSIGGLLGGLFEPRAVLEARLLISSEVTEMVTYVETVQVSDTLTGSEFEVTL